MMEEKVRIELWIMVVLRLGGPLPTGIGKGKEKEKEIGEGLMDEGKLAGLKLLLELIKPVVPSEEDDEDDVLGSKIDWTNDPIDTLLSKPLPSPPSPPPLSILFHTLTTLLALSSHPSSLPTLQSTALTALSILLHTCFLPLPEAISPPPLLATALPGTVSTLSRVSLSLPSTTSTLQEQSFRQPSSAIIGSLKLLQEVLVAALSDSITTSLRPSNETPDSLTALISPPPQASSAPPPETATTPSTPGPTIPTPSWLISTISSLTPILNSVSSRLSSHTNPQVRSSLITFLSTLLNDCSSSINPPTTYPLLRALLVLTKDDWTEVNQCAKSSVLNLKLKLENSEGFKAILIESLKGLSGVIKSGDEVSVRKNCKIIVGGLELGFGLEGGEIDRWGWGLLSACEFSVGGLEGRGLGKITNGDGQEGDDWPEIEMKFVKERITVRELEKVWKAFGSTEVVGEWVLDLATKGELKKSSTAMWVLVGISEGLKDRGKKKKFMRGIVREVLGLWKKLDEEEENSSDTFGGGATVLKSGAEEEAEEASLNLPIEQSRGVSITPSLDLFNPIPVSSTLNSTILPRCLSLRILSTLAPTSPSHLHLILYYHLTSLSSPSSLLSSYAQHSLSRLSSHSPSSQLQTTTSTPTTLILQNVDYLLNIISLRLSPSRLDLNAASVLIQMIKLTGSSVLPMLGGTVEDVLDALDDWHGYDLVCGGLWAVLDALVGVLGGGEVEERGSRTKEKEIGHWERFESWLENRVRDKEEEEEGETSTLPHENPKKPFADTLPSEGSPLDDSNDKPPQQPTSSTDELPPIPPIPSQVLASQVLSKAVYFLSHESPFLRSKILSLIGSCVSLFSTPFSPTEALNPNRHSQYLPAINRAWPYILRRLSISEHPSVIFSAIELLEALSVHSGEYMGRRITEDAWPLILKLLDHELALEKNWSAAGDSGRRFNHSTKLAYKILVLLQKVVKNVPLKEEVVWDMSVACRRFLAEGEDADIRRASIELFEELKEVNDDAVWVVVDGTVEAGEDKDKADMPWLALENGRKVSRDVADRLFSSK